MMRLVVWRALYLSLLLCAAWPTQAQDIALRPVSSTTALTRVFIVSAPGATPVFGTILIKNGLIEAAGPSVVIPGQARIVDGDSMYVYAGFISGLSQVAVPKPERQESPERVADPGNASRERAGITPQSLVSEKLDPKDKDLSEYRAAGFTMAHVVPMGQMMPGQGALVLLHGDSPEAMLIKDQVSLFAQWQGALGVYPSNLLGVMATWKDLYHKTEMNIRHEKSYAANPAGKARPQTSPEEKALFPVVNRTLPVMFEANDLMSVHRAINLSEELGFSLMIGEVGESWSLAKTFSDKKIPVFLTMDLPELEKDLANPDTITDARRKEAAQLRQRKNEIAMNHINQAKMMAEAGTAFGFSTMEVKPKDVMENLGVMMSHGLSADQALTALTTAPAQLLGLSAVAGTVSPGKMANLVVMDAPFGAEKNSVRMTIVEGEVFQFEAKKKKKADAANSAPVLIAGKWRYMVESPQGSNGGILTIKGEDGSYEGTIESDRMGTAVDLNDVTLAGNNLTFSYSVDGGGRSFTVNVDVEVEGDSFEGTVSVGEFGTFDIEGDREPGN
ncbi:MAG: amidohydrolase family protein [Bacteroidia bacterium]|nr:amidohydrolase family protein [Bacteroidia bacterium]